MCIVKLNISIRNINIMTCHHCQGRLSLLKNFNLLLQVTSDCRPWKKGGNLAVCEDCSAVQKPLTDEWLKEADEIYSQYNIYSQSGGVEQSAFDQAAGASTSRSSKIVEWLSSTGQIPNEGKLLDIGCGNGAFLKAFGQKNRNWEMTGLELDSRSEDIIMAIPGVTKLHIGAVEDLHERFDLIVLIHALEHIPHPVQYLNTLKNYLTPSGLLFIEVPDLTTSPFDILIADHSTHFVSDTLDRVAKSAGFETITLKSDFVPKELSLLAKSNENQSEIKLIKGHLNSGKIANDRINGLLDLIEKANKVEGKVGIFGTSISATWLTESLGKKVSFFIDEDQSRIGHNHLGIKIYGVKDFPKGFPIILPLRLDVAKSVISRFEDEDLEFILPS